MPQSQNATFAGRPVESPGEEHPPGYGLIEALAGRLNAVGWTATELDNWRDVGWRIECRRAAAQLEIVVAALDGPEKWMLQIAPLRGAGLLGGLLGRKPSATPDDCLELAQAVHDTLPQCGKFKGVLWRWDAPPVEGKS